MDDGSGIRHAFKQRQGIFNDDALLVSVSRLAERLTIRVFYVQGAGGSNAHGLLQTLRHDDARNAVFFEDPRYQPAGLIANGSSCADQRSIHVVGKETTRDLRRGLLHQSRDVVANDEAHEPI